MSDTELFAQAKQELFTALVGDIMDKMGLFHQFLPQNLKPLDSKMVVIGRAMTVLEEDLPEITPYERLEKPFGIMFEALDQLRENEVYVCSGSSPTYALWGGLMSTRAIKLGASGAILNGMSRDTNEILRLNFPTFSLGTYAVDQGPRGRVVAYRTPIDFEGVTINPGDIIFGDRDGVIVIPGESEKEVFDRAFEKARGEKLVLKELQNGMSTVDAFEKYGIM
ncbi:MAG: RraA family protein [Balneolaceae bacterium]|nr:MAG: RraA family protein [Balneolaceae bacterium]